MVGIAIKERRGARRRNICLHQIRAALSEKASCRRGPEQKAEDHDLAETDKKGDSCFQENCFLPFMSPATTTALRSETLYTKQEKVVEIFSLRQGATDSAQGVGPTQGKTGGIIVGGGGCVRNPGQETAILGLSPNLEKRQYSFCPPAGYGQTLPEKYSEIFRNSQVTSSLGLSETSE